MDYYLRALKLAEELDDKLRIATACINIGALYNNKDNTKPLAKEYYERALPISIALDDKDAIGTVTVNLGELYMEYYQDDSTALSYFMQSLDAYTGSENLPYTLNDIGKLYLKKKITTDHYNTIFKRMILHR